MSSNTCPSHPILRHALPGLCLCFIALWLLGCQTTAPVSNPIITPTPTLPPADMRPTLIAPSASPTPVPTLMNKRGIHLLLDDGRNVWPQSMWSSHLRHARQLVGEGGYVTELIRSTDLDPARWQVFMDECATLQLMPIVRLATFYDQDRHFWSAPPVDAQGHYTDIAAQYARFIAALRWPRTSHYVIIGNEPNHGDEWGGQADPAAYARFLLEVGQALQRADPEVRIMNAPLDPFTPHTNGQPFINGLTYLDAETFLDQMHAAQPAAFSVIDVWATHAYPLGPLAAGPWQQAFQIDLLNGAHNPDHLTPPAGIFNRGVNGYAWELWKLSTYGLPALPVMITETGWRHQESVDVNALDNGRSWPTAVTVTQFIDLAYYGNQGRYPHWPETGWIPWQADERVLGVTPFALDGAPHEWGHTNWLQLDANGQVVGSYPLITALRPPATAAPP